MLTFYLIHDIINASVYYKSKCLAHPFPVGELRAYRQFRFNKIRRYMLGK